MTAPSIRSFYKITVRPVGGDTRYTTLQCALGDHAARTFFLMAGRYTVMDRERDTIDENGRSLQLPLIDLSLHRALTQMGEAKSLTAR